MHTGGTLKKYDNKVPAGDGANLPISTYVLEYQIGNTLIVLKNELGHQNLGSIIT